MKTLFLATLIVLLVSCSSDENNNNTTTPVITAPVLTTAVVNSITQLTVNSGGNITSNGGADITARGVVWSTSQNPTISLTTKTNDGVGLGAYTSNIAGLSPNTTYYVRAYATNSVGTAYGNEVNFITTSIQLPVLTTTTISNITLSTASSGGDITSDGVGTIIVRGVIWSTSQNPTIALSTKTTDGTGIGTFTSNITGLTANTTYYVRAYATNSAGTAYGLQLSFTTIASYTQMYPTGTIFCNSVVTAVVDVTNPVTGKTWMDRNLGASQKATSITDANAYGDIYQWGRRADGHQCRTSGVTTTLSSTDQPSHGDFIYGSPTGDWRSPQNDNLWQGVNGINNPCPNGYRLPTENEYINEIQSWSTPYQNGAFLSNLKYTLPGARNPAGGGIFQAGIFGMYWTSTISGTEAKTLIMRDINDPNPSPSGVREEQRNAGFTIRCIKN
jgi:hypothetical protein